MDEEWIDRMMKSTEMYHQELRDHFARLLHDAVPQRYTVGERVVVALGLIGRGHPWVRGEGLVIEVAGSSVKVRFVGRAFLGQEDESWIDPVLILNKVES